MKTVFLATCYFQPNYGSVLQAFATQLFLDINSISNLTININGISEIIKQRKMAHFKRNIFNYDIVTDKLSYLKLIVNRKINSKLDSNISKRTKIFEEFYTKKFNLTAPFDNFDELSSACDNSVRAVVVGSDQLWLPTNIEADYYTLNFVPDNILRISYATSFGVSSLPSPQESKARQFLDRFDFISVREQSGSLIVEKLIAKKPVLVCDPVLLICAQQWRDLIKDKKPPKNKYIFCYLLGKEKEHYLWVKKLSKVTGCQIIGLTNIDTYLNIADVVVDVPRYDADPFDFVALIQGAEYICTDSFHATVFSIMFHKKVFAFRRFAKRSKMSTNGRLESLFKTLCIDGGFVSSNSPIETEITKVFDYKNIELKIDILQKQSAEYLLGALQ